MSDEVCVITGVGPGTGSALVRKFAERYKVVMIARNAQRLEELAAEVPGTIPFICDVADADALQSTLQSIDRIGAPKIVIHNAVGGASDNVLALDPHILQRNFQINTMALLHLVQAFAPSMIAAGAGCYSRDRKYGRLPWKSQLFGMAPTKAAQRILLESTARSLGPQGVHVAYIAIDAAIDVPWTRKALPDHPDSFFASPADIAAECFHVAHQPAVNLDL